MAQWSVGKKFLERGQAIILIALAITGLVAMVGLMVDGGMLLIEYARLKRGIDAASVSAALQFRKNYSIGDLVSSATQFLGLNQIDVATVEVNTCDGGGNPAYVDASLCTMPRRKLVRVTAMRHVQFGFLPVLGIRETDIQASSVGEAASIDMVLVIDTSASMSYETLGNNPDDPDPSGPDVTPRAPDATDDPAQCNASDACQPMKAVKDVINNPALPDDDLLDTLFFPYDRVAIITMTSQIPNGARDPFVVRSIADDNNDPNYDSLVRADINSLKVFQPPACDTLYGPCLDYPADRSVPPDGINDFYGLKCPVRISTGDPASCGSSNIGGALLLAGNEFAIEPIRQDSFWVVIVLVGGPANASDRIPSASLTTDPGYFGFCPHNPPGNDTWVIPYCRDDVAAVRHPSGDPNYDADDFARDRADFVANPVTGQGATVFTIGLGDLVVNAPIRDDDGNGSTEGDANAGELLLQYIALQAGDVPSVVNANHGLYFYAPGTSQLQDIFLEIADNITTRISQ